MTATTPPSAAAAGRTDPLLSTADLEAEAARLPWNAVGLARPPAATSDLRAWLPPVVDQRGEPLCTAVAVSAAAAYHAARGAGRWFTPSVLFTYRTSRALTGRPDRRGSTVRDSLAAWATCGLVEDRRWPLDLELVGTDPPADCFAAAAAHRNVRYGRLDGPGTTGDRLRELAVACLSWGLPVTIEFALTASLARSLRSGVLPVPAAADATYGRHVVLCVGHHDTIPVGSHPDTGSPLRGAFLVHNSWGRGWGASGYGWLPYAFLERPDTREAWVVTSWLVGT